MAWLGARTWGAVMARPKRWRPVPQRLVETDQWHLMSNDSKLVYLMLHAFVCDGHGCFPWELHELLPKLMLDPTLVVEAIDDLEQRALITRTKDGEMCLVPYDEDLPSYYLSKVPKKTLVYIDKEKGIKKKSKSKTKSKTQDDRFGEFWELWRPRLNRAQADKSWKKLSSLDQDAALAGLKRYVGSPKFKEAERTRNWKYMPHPSTWLNGKRWEDEDLKAAVPDHHRPTGEEVVFLD